MLIEYCLYLWAGSSSFVSNSNTRTLHRTQHRATRIVIDQALSDQFDALALPPVPLGIF